MNTIRIEHRLGVWLVEVITGCSDVPAGCSDWDSFGRGFTYQGHAVAYLKRLANHTPDTSARWVVYEFNERWYVATRNEAK